MVKIYLPEVLWFNELLFFTILRYKIKKKIILIAALVQKL